MRIALCLSGIPRFWETFNKDDYGDVDIFIHSWEESSLDNNCLKNNFDGSIGLNYKWDTNILSRLNPKKYLIESLSKYDFEEQKKKFRINEGKCRDSVLPMFCSLYKSIQLCLPYDYDIVIRSRFDIRFIQQIKYINDSTIKIPDQFHYLGLCDQFAYGPTNLMSQYSKVYLYLQDNRDIQLNPEIILKKYIRKVRLKTTLTNDEFIILR